MSQSLKINILQDKQIEKAIDPKLFGSYAERKSFKIKIQKIQSQPNARKCINQKCNGWILINLNDLKNLNYECSFCLQNNCLECKSCHPKMPCYEYELQILQSNDCGAIDKLTSTLSENRLKAHAYLISAKVDNYNQAENVVQLIEEYPDMDESDIIWAAKQTTHIENVKPFLGKTCELCTETYSLNHFFSMVHCEHSFCSYCMKQYFEFQVNYCKYIAMYNI